MEGNTFLYLKSNDDTPAMKTLLEKGDLSFLHNNIPHAGSNNQTDVTHHLIHMCIDV